MVNLEPFTLPTEWAYTIPMTRRVRRIVVVVLGVLVALACIVVVMRVMIPRGDIFVLVTPHATTSLQLVDVRVVERGGEVVTLNCTEGEYPEGTHTLTCARSLREGVYPDIEFVWSGVNESIPFSVTRAPNPVKIDRGAVTAVLTTVDVERSRVLLENGDTVLLPFVIVEVRNNANVSADGSVKGGVVATMQSMGTDRFGVLRQNVRVADMSLKKTEDGLLRPIEQTAEGVPETSEGIDQLSDTTLDVATSTSEADTALNTEVIPIPQDSQTDND